MSTGVPLQVLIAPIVIAVTAVATMMLMNGARSPRRVSSELGYAPDPATSLSLTLGRYLGGYPGLPQPFPKPFMLLTHEHLALFARRWGPLIARIGWDKVEHVTVLNRQEAEAAALAVRGLATGAFDGAPDDALYVRVRFEDERGWWQNMLFELSDAQARAMADEVIRHWQARRGAESAG